MSDDGSGNGSGSGHGNGSGNGNGNGNGNGWKKTKEGLEEAKKRLVGSSAPQALEVAATKKDPGTYAVAHEKIWTNAMGVRLPAIPIYMYDVTVIGVTKNDKKRELAKQSREDYTSLLRKNMCFAAYKNLRDHNDAFADKTVFYDGQKMMYSLDKLKLNGGLERTFVVEVNPVEYDVEFARIEFTVKQVPSTLVLNDKRSLLNDMRNPDRSLLQFIDLATAQYPLMHPQDFISYDGGRTYLVNPGEVGFLPQDAPELSDGKFVAIGARKSTLAVEGPKGRGGCNVAVLVDTSKTAFHCSQSVLNKALMVVPRLLDQQRIDQMDVAKLRKQLSGLYAEKKQNGNSVAFLITSVSLKNAFEVSFVYEGKNLSVADYYEARYKLKLRYPHLPLLVNRKGKDKESFFPMELCHIIEKQRVKQQHQTAKQLQEMRTACIVPPAKRRQNNERNVAALHLTDENNEYLLKSGIGVIPKPFIAEGRVLPTPQVTYDNRDSQKIDLERMWTIGRKHYFFPAELQNWAAYLIGDRRERMGESDFTKFIERMVEQGSKVGMRINKPADMGMIPADKDRIEETIRVAKNERCTFVFFVQSDGANLHDCIKSLERKYEIVTQDLKVSTALQVVQRGKWQTLENVVNKFNVKLSGLNYSILPPDSKCEEYLKDGRLIIGFAMTHPGPPSPAEIARGGSGTPTVVGYSANCKTENCEFIGDFGFQDARRMDNVLLVDTFVKRIAEQYMRNRKKAIRELIVYRSGVSEGQYDVLLDYEIPLIRGGLREAGCDNAVKLTMIVVSRMHNIRLMPERVNERDKPAAQNCRPGTVIDKQLVHPQFSEFYLDSHKALQGTAKVPRYTVVVDDSNFTMDELEMMTYALCYCHQIVNLPTSVPTPLYVATRYAERGRRIMMERCESSDGVSTSGSGTSRSVDLHTANAELPYYGTPLGEIRINA